MFACEEIIMPRQSCLPRPLLLPLLLALSAAPLAAQAAPVYTVAPVTAPGTDAQPNGLNNAGQVAGYAYTPGGGHTYAYTSRNGTATSLHPADPQVSDSNANAINDSGVAAGTVTYRDAATHAAVFSNGSVQVLGTLGGDNSTAYGINAGGQVVGNADLADGGGRHAFVTQAGGGLLDLGTLGGPNSVADAINDHGVVTGYTDIDDAGSYRAFVYTNGTMRALDTLGGSFAEGLAINNAGMVAGYSGVTDDLESHAFLYANGVLVDLGTFGGGDSYATGINESGDVVGTATNGAGVYHAFLYSGGRLQDLNELIDSSLGWTVTYAADINDHGQIAARGCKAGNQCADLLLTLAATDGGGDGPSAVPEPEALTAGLAGLILSGLLRRRRRPR
jgi:probable HAF family extracellular repeat protein